jgi:hypothetical protein
VLLEGGEVALDRVVDTEVDHLEPGAFEHHRDEVLPDVVDVALDGADHDLAHPVGARLREERPEHLHPRLHGIGGEEHLGNEEDAVAEVDADDPHPLDEGVAQRLLGRPAALEQDLRAAGDLVGEAVVEVVVHLLHELVVAQRLEDDLLVRHAAPRFLSSYPS